MGFDQSFHELYNTSIVKFVSSATTLKLHERCVRAASAGGAFTVTLPPVAEAVGLIFSIRKIDAAANAVTVADSDDSEGWSDVATIDALNDTKLYYSDGRRWHEIASVIA